MAALLSAAARHGPRARMAPLLSAAGSNVLDTGFDLFASWDFRGQGRQVRVSVAEHAGLPTVSLHFDTRVPSRRLFLALGSQRPGALPVVVTGKGGRSGWTRHSFELGGPDRLLWQVCIKARHLAQDYVWEVGVAGAPLCRIVLAEENPAP